MHHLASPHRFQMISSVALPFLAAATVLLLGFGLVEALLTSPTDYKQGEFVRLMYVHVPAAWMAMGIYAFMALSSAAALIWRHPLADILAQQAAPIGAAFTALCLTTGMLWGKPMWGAWWVWDARLTSVLLLLFLYIGYMALLNAHANPERASKPAALLVIAGAVNLPIIKFSVDWWHTLHQPSSVFRLEGSSIHPEMMTPLMLMALGCLTFFLTLLLLRTKAVLLERKWQRQQRDALRSAMKTQPKTKPSSSAVLSSVPSALEPR